MAWLKVPFCALSVPVDLDDGGVDHRVFHIRLLRDGFEQANPHVGRNPIAKARAGRVPVAEQSRNISPGASRSHDPENGLHEPAVVAPAASGITRFAQTVRFHFRPLGVGQNESVHPEFESQSLTNENPESKQALGSGLTTAIAFWI